MPVTKPPNPSDKFNASTNNRASEHDTINAAAAYLLVIGRRAIHAYASSKGYPLDALVPLLADTVCAWVDAQGGSRDAVSLAAKGLDDEMLHADFPSEIDPQRVLDKRQQLSFT